ncbi:hypothetical protein E4U43_000295 [Claviceps pusilla]|uniref:Uncharacterized protein n=1 Tax=Claviceps pusilla TaxID=123648 RepID=A0A9P7NAV6_9HYPO|nr:hypothetical protein E4U43_000295 [Claviceps pusilla]
MLRNTQGKEDRDRRVISWNPQHETRTSNSPGHHTKVAKASRHSWRQSWPNSGKRCGQKVGLEVQVTAKHELVKQHACETSRVSASWPSWNLFLLIYAGQKTKELVH